MLTAQPALSTRPEGINGTVDQVESESVSIAGKTYRMGKQFRVVIVTFEGDHRFERPGRKSNIRPNGGRCFLMTAVFPVPRAPNKKNDLCFSKSFDGL